jgi:MFS family permease
MASYASCVRQSADIVSTKSSTAPLSPDNSRHIRRGSVDLCVFPTGDPEDPRNFARWKKYLLIGSILLIDLSVSWGASAYSPASTKFSENMHVSTEIAVLGLSLYVIGLALGPMSLAPLSEYFGRSPIYIVSYAVYLLFIMATALVPNLGGFLALRFLSGLFSSVTIANFGGTIADLYEPQETGYAMSLFLWAATVGSPTGYFLFSFVAQTRTWREVFWALLGVSGGFWIIMTVALLIVGETRHSVLLLRRAERERKLTGRDDIDVPDEFKRRGPKELFKVALTRPFRFLFTEAIIMFGAAYNGYLYGLSFLFNDAFSLVFGPTGHGFNTIGVGLSFLGVVVGISLGPITNIWQERYFRNRVNANDGHVIPEARVQMAKVAAIGRIMLSIEMHCAKVK